MFLLPPMYFFHVFPMYFPMCRTVLPCIIGVTNCFIIFSFFASTYLEHVSFFYFLFLFETLYILKRTAYFTPTIPPSQLQHQSMTSDLNKLIQPNKQKKKFNNY